MLISFNGILRNMEMEDYCVRFWQTPSTKLEMNLDVNMKADNGMVRKCIIESNFNQEKKDAGITFTEYLKSENPKKALEMATGDVDMLCSVISFISGVSLPRPFPILIYSTSSDRQKHILNQFDKVPCPIVVTGKVGAELTSELFRDIFSLEEDTRQRVISSIQLFSRAQMVASEDPFICFMLLWIAIDLLDPSIKDRNRIEKIQEIDTNYCPECKRPTSSTMILGIEAFLKEKHTEMITQLKDAKELRSRIFHGPKNFAKSRNECNDYLNFLIELYVVLIGYLTRNSLGDKIPKKFISKIECILDQMVDIEMSTNGVFFEPPGHPGINLDEAQVNWETDADGKILVTIKAEGEFLKLKKGAKVNGPARLSSTGLNIGSAKIEIVPKKGSPQGITLFSSK